MNVEVIQNKIYEIRGIKIMLDYDLAVLYQTETKRLKEAVRRNKRRFPHDFMFELTKEEYNSLRTQIATSKRGGNRYPPFAFSEHGVAMLAAVLNSDKAIENLLDQNVDKKEKEEAWMNRNRIGFKNHKQ